MSDLRALIDELMALRPGADFALFFSDSGVGNEPWTVAFVNPAHCVSLGEVPGKYEGGGDTPEEAVRGCIANVKGRSR